MVIQPALNWEEAGIGGLVARMAQVKEEQVRITDNSGSSPSYMLPTFALECLCATPEVFCLLFREGYPCRGS